MLTRWKHEQCHKIQVNYFLFIHHLKNLLPNLWKIWTPKYVKFRMALINDVFSTLISQFWWKKFWIHFNLTLVTFAVLTANYMSKGEGAIMCTYFRSTCFTVLKSTSHLLKIGSYVNPSPVHRLYKVDYIKFGVDTLSRHFATFPIYFTRMLPPPHVKVYVRPIRCMSKYMNIEDI